jgi:hypothetical protein
LIYEGRPYISFKRRYGYGISKFAANLSDMANYWLIKSKNHDPKQVKAIEDSLSDLCYNETGAEAILKETTARIGEMKAHNKEETEDYFRRFSILFAKIQSNVFTVREEWLCIFNLPSMMNHACDPNCRIVFDEECNAKIITLRNIKKGEELTLSYREYNKNGDQRRRKELIFRQLGFNCKCSLCQ